MQIDVVTNGLYIIAINPDKCIIGGSCNSQTKGIGITLDDILRYEINQNMTLKNQSLLVKISVALTMIMLIMGLINSILSLLTFQNADLRKVGCGIYLLASSITSLLTISMFTINFSFILLNQMNSSIDLSTRRGGCISIEPLLKLFLYFDTWLNACVAIERAINVYQGISFNKEKSKRLARWIIFILPFCITATIIHEPLHRDVFEHQVKERDEWFEMKVIEIYRWCAINYSRVVKDYNTAILFIHLIGPFIANLFSALFIIFGTARQRSLAQTSRSYVTHIREQLREHKQLVISPAILLILAMPRLIISLLSGCVKIESDIFMVFLNLTVFLPIDSVSSSDMEGLEQGYCVKPYLTFLLRTQSILLLIFGFAANLCSFVVLTRPRLRRRPTFSYLAFLSLSNALLSLIHATFNLLAGYFDIAVEHLPLFIFCRFLNRFAIDFLTHFSLYTLTAVDLDRIRTVTSKTANDQRYSRTNSGRQRGCASAFIRVCLVESFLAIISFLFNAHWLVLYGYVEKDPTSLDDITVCAPFLNDTSNFNIYTEAYNKYVLSILPIAEIVLFNILPFVISVLATIIILRHISIKYTLLSHINKRLKKSRRRMELHLSILLISLNCVFILLTTPHNIYQVYILKIREIPV
ncbi:unnamed protein product [Adineta steineri]|uniref:G-protein coupled receptors family 1 profile domain-containing protein n=2 Tax=Adineta steineri TaxID=433720 RepID=A0A813SJU0_9BILA|nr:unnamed protein product [Adineta steineri]